MANGLYISRLSQWPSSRYGLYSPYLSWMLSYYMKGFTAMKTDTSGGRKRLVFKKSSLPWIQVSILTTNLLYYKAAIVHNVIHLDTKPGDASTARKVMCNESHYSSSVLKGRNNNKRTAKQIHSSNFILSVAL